MNISSDKNKYLYVVFYNLILISNCDLESDVGFICSQINAIKFGGETFYKIRFFSVWVKEMNV